MALELFGQGSGQRDTGGSSAAGARRQMNTELALKTIEVLEPYARRLIEQAARKGPAYEKQWFLALQQAELVVAAYDAPEEPIVAEDAAAGDIKLNS